jgi:ferritin-like metal-binding protein YciE
LKQLYISELRDLYSAENQLLKALPNMAKGASSPELKDAFENHLEQTKGHVERLEEVFEQLDESPKGKTCHPMKRLIKEGSEILKEEGEDSVLDAGIIVAAQKVEHYEIVSYGSVRAFAGLLNQEEPAKLLQADIQLIVLRQRFWSAQANGAGISAGQSAAVRRGACVLHSLFTRAVDSRFARCGRYHLSR